MEEERRKVRIKENGRKTLGSKERDEGEKEGMEEARDGKELSTTRTK